MNILENLINEAKQHLLKSEEDLKIDNIILGKTLYTMKDSDIVFNDMNFCLILLKNAYGFSYFQQEIDYSVGSFVNKNALKIIDQEMPNYMRVAITDALYCIINRKRFINKFIFKGDIRQKARKRAKVLFDHIPGGSKILLLGAATEIIEEAITKKCNLKVLDLEKQKIGLKFSSTYIESSNKLNLKEKIKETDYIIATGMIFVSETANEIFEFASKNEKKITLYMETGSNFGPQLLKYGADTVLSEFFPYYDFFGETKYLLFQKKRK